MPKGVYPRTQNQLKAAVANLAKGRLPEVRKRVAVKLKENAADPAWRAKVSKATTLAMRQPDIRRRHLKALKGNPVNFQGGNGQPPTRTIEEKAKELEPLGYIREYPIKTKGHQTGLNPPPHYKADFAHPDLRIVIEMDGPSHQAHRQQVLDRKKTIVLQALGWKVIRIKH